MYTMDMSGTKWSIFVAALDLFAKEGYHNVSMTQIADAARIRPSSIYNHFPCKDALLEMMYNYYEYYTDLYAPNMERLMAGIETEEPKRTLVNAICSLPEELEEPLAQIFQVASSMQGDARAKMLVQKYFFHIPTECLTTLLNTMIEKNLIEPLDVDSFVFVYCSVSHSVHLRMCGPYPIERAERERVVGYLLGLVIRSKQPA